MSALSALLNTYRAAFASEREKGNYFEGLICAYLRLPAQLSHLLRPLRQSIDIRRLDQRTRPGGRDTGIDLVARTQGTGEYHAIQCKLYAEDYRIRQSTVLASHHRHYDQQLERARRGCLAGPAASGQQDRYPSPGRRPDRLG